MIHYRSITGFTLLEVMVVLSIIGMLLGLVSLGGSGRQAQSDTESFAVKVQGLLDQTRSTAVFQNLDLAIGMQQGQATVLVYTSIYSQEFAAGLDVEQLEKLKDNPWQEYDGLGGGTFTLPDNILWSLTMNDQVIDFDDLITLDEELLPAVVFLSSDEYSPFELQFTHEADPGFVTRLIGDGLNPPIIASERVEQL